jgi:hypothetical protein
MFDQRFKISRIVVDFGLVAPDTLLVSFTSTRDAGNDLEAHDHLIVFKDDN